MLNLLSRLTLLQMTKLLSWFPPIPGSKIPKVVGKLMANLHYQQGWPCHRQRRWQQWWRRWWRRWWWWWWWEWCGWWTWLWWRSVDRQPLYQVSLGEIFFQNIIAINFVKCWSWAIIDQCSIWPEPYWIFKFVAACLRSFSDDFCEDSEMWKI